MCHIVDMCFQESGNEIIKIENNEKKKRNIEGKKEYSNNICENYYISDEIIKSSEGLVISVASCSFCYFFCS